MINKYIKKMQVIVLAAVMVCSLAGCGTSNTKKDKGKEITLTYAIWDKIQEPGLRKEADAFEAKNPGIKVKIQVTPWDQYWTKLEAGAEGGELPDVFWMHSNEIARYSEAGMLYDVTKSVSGSDLVDMSKFPEGLVNLYRWEEKYQYAIPKDYDTIGLWYNKKLFDEAKLEYPTKDWTVEDLKDAAVKLTNKEKDVYGFAAPLQPQDGIWPFIYLNGGMVISEDKKTSGFHDPATVEAMKWYVDLGLTEKISPSIDEFAENTPVALFESGKVAMGFFGSWMMSEFLANDYTKANCDVTTLPKGKVESNIYNGLGNAMPAEGKHTEAAWKFLEFLSSEEGQRIHATEGVAISAYEGMDIEWTKSSDVFNLESCIEQLDVSVIRPYSKSTIKWETLETDILKKAFSGETSVEDACKELAEGMDAILAEE